MSFERGDSIICIDDDDMGLITNDFEYKVVDIVDKGYIRIVNDMNRFGTYHSSRFFNIRESRNEVIDSVLDL